MDLLNSIDRNVVSDPLVKKAAEGIIKYAKHIKCSKKTLKQIIDKINNGMFYMVPANYYTAVCETKYDFSYIIDLKNKLGVHVKYVIKRNGKFINLKSRCYTVKSTSMEVYDFTGVYLCNQELEKYIMRILLHEMMHLISCNVEKLSDDIIIQKAGLIKKYYFMNKKDKRVDYDDILNEVLNDFFASQIYNYMYNEQCIEYEYVSDEGKFLSLGTKYVYAVPIFTMLNLIEENQKNAHYLFDAYINNDKKVIAKSLYDNTGMYYSQVVNCCNTLVNQYTVGKCFVEEIYNKLLNKLTEMKLDRYKKEKIKNILQFNFRITKNSEYYYVYKQYIKCM